MAEWIIQHNQVHMAPALTWNESALLPCLERNNLAILRYISFEILEFCLNKAANEESPYQTVRNLEIALVCSSTFSSRPKLMLYRNSHWVRWRPGGVSRTKFSSGTRKAHIACASIVCIVNIAEQCFRPSKNHPTWAVLKNCQDSYRN